MAAKILFISHEASRTGAPILLLQFMKWLKSNTDFSFSIIVCETGPLLSEFQALGETYVIKPRFNLIERVIGRVFGYAFLRQVMDNRLKKWCRKQKCNLVYVNTVCPIRQMELLACEGYPVICHVHELDYILQAAVGYEAFARIIPLINHFIAGSKAVQDYLTTRWHIPTANSTLVHEFTLPTKAQRFKSREAMRMELGLTNGDILVGTCGTLDWRKGADLFIQIANYVQKDPTGAKLHFLWIGGDKKSFEYARFMHDLSACGLNKRVTVIEPCPNYLDYISAMDIFALTSREDPFPLVMLDAAALGLPMVCFEASGGGPEFAGNDAGMVAPYLDTATFAKNILSLAADKEARQRLGAMAARKLDQNFTVDMQAPKLLEVINRFLPHKS